MHTIASSVVLARIEKNAEVELGAGLGFDKSKDIKDWWAIYCTNSGSVQEKYLNV